LEKQEETEEKSGHKKENSFWSEIFERLKTAELNNSICDYRMSVYQPSIKKEFETSISWQMRQADEIQLAYMKQYIFHGEEINLPEQTNYYEKKHIHPAHITEKEVLSQLAAAILIQLAQEFKYQQYSQKKTDEFLWTDFTKAFYGSSTDVIERFEEYQTRNEMRAEELASCLVEWNKLVQEENDIIQVFTYFNVTGEEKTADGVSEGEVVFTLLENQNMQKQFMETVRILEGFSIQEFVLENQKIDKSYLETLFRTQQSLYEFHEEYRNTQTKLSELRLNQIEEDEKETEAERNSPLSASYDGKEFNYYLQQHTDFSELTESMDADEMEKLVHREANEEETAETAAQSMGQQAGVTEQYQQVFLSEEEYAAYLNEVNRRNLEMNRRYYESEGTAEPHKMQQIVLNRESARKSALRALENPKEVLAEIYEKGQAIEVPDFGETERYLSLVDEQTKAFYYNLLYGGPKKEKQPWQDNAKMENDMAGQPTVMSERTTIEQILVNQRNQYFLMQEVLEKNLQTLHDYLETEQEEKQEENVTAVDMRQTNEEGIISHCFERILENQLRQQQIFRTFSDETYSEIFTQQIVKIKELIQQIKNLQQKAGNVVQNNIQKSFAAGLQELTEIQNVYLNEVDTVQRNHVLQQGSRMKVLNKITEIQMQYTQKLLQIKQNNIFSSITRVHPAGAAEIVSEQMKMPLGDETKMPFSLTERREIPKEAGRQSTAIHADRFVENEQMFFSEEEYAAYLNEVNKTEREINDLYYREGTEETAKKQQEKVMQMSQIIAELKKDEAGQETAASDSTVFEQIMINQRNQYFLMQEMLENNLYAFHHNQETVYTNAGEEKAAEEAQGQTTEERIISDSLEQILENQLRQQQMFQTFHDEKYSEIFTRQIKKIQELIQQLKQQKTEIVMQGKVQKSAVVELQKLAEIQNEYLNEVDTVQNNQVLQQNDSITVWNTITEMQTQYTKKLLQLLRQNIISPLTRVQQNSVLETESEEMFAERIKEVQAVLLESQKSLWRFYYNKIKQKTTGETVRTETPVELSEYIRMDSGKPVINWEESSTQFEMIHHQSQVWNEDMAEEIQSSIKNHIRTEQNIIETIDWNQQAKQKVVEERQELVTKTETNITELIQQNLKNQLNEISNEVYQKLERKLESERRRRGY
jgi:hypothetical protein